MPFLDLLPAERVRTDLSARDKNDLLDQLGDVLADGASATVARDALRSRERLGGTGLGHGVAIPHGAAAPSSMPARPSCAWRSRWISALTTAYRSISSPPCSCPRTSPTST
jgi:hypothetical protein